MGIEGIGSNTSASMTLTGYQASATTTVTAKPAEATSKVVKPIETTEKKGADSRESLKQEKEQEKETLQIQDVDPEKVKNAIKEINGKIRPTRTECQFSYHEETKRIAIKVLDQDTGDVIREIPPEKTLYMIAKVWEMAGILVDEKR